jgi:hypothetical protein
MLQEIAKPGITLNGGVKMLQEIAKPGNIKSFRISENKFLRLLLKDQKFFVELVGSGYNVIQLAGKTLQEAEKFYETLLKEIF